MGWRQTPPTVSAFGIGTRDTEAEIVSSGAEFFVARVQFNTKDTKDTKVRIVGPSFVSLVSFVFPDVGIS